MKRFIYVFIIFAAFVLALAISIKPIIIFISRIALKNVFIGSEVSIGGCVFNPASQISLSNIKIKKDKIYDFEIKEAGIYYRPLSIVKGNIAKLYLKDTSIDMDLGKKSIQDFSKYLKLSSKSAFLINTFELENLSLDLKSKELSVKTKLSAELDAKAQLVNSLDLKMVSMDAQGISMKEASLKVEPLIHEGNLYVKEIKYNKLVIEAVKGKAELKGMTLSLTSIYGQLLGGDISGDFKLQAGKNLKYSFNFKLSDIDLDKFVNDFDLKEKFQLSGRLSGAANLSGQNTNIRDLSGDFSTSGLGGVLIIKDAKFLENMARNSGESLDILVESFKNYHYNTGIMKLSFDKGNLIFNVVLEGEVGKRNLTITLHNFGF